MWVQACAAVGRFDEMKRHFEKKMGKSGPRLVSVYLCVLFEAGLCWRFACGCVLVFVGCVLFVCVLVSRRRCVRWCVWCVKGVFGVYFCCCGVCVC